MNEHTHPSSQLIEKFADIVGEKNTLTIKDDLSHFTHENRKYIIGETSAVLKPASTREVSEILKLATQTKTPIVPQGGHTGHMGGGVPLDGAIVVCLARMNEIIDVDLIGNTLRVQSGAVLQNIQEVASQNNRLFPLALGAQGSCMIGGNISTNAGGTGVLAFGNTRELVMGLEVVLPNGDIWDGQNKLRKNNTGYDLKNLFIGAEGTLGIVTAATLKLFPANKGKEVAIAGFDTLEKALDFFIAARETAASQLTAFEIMPRRAIEFLQRHFPDTRDPLVNSHNWYALVEISSTRSQEQARGITEEILGSAVENELIADCVLATNILQQRQFWKMREELPASQRPEGASIAHDVSVPIDKIPELVKRGSKLIEDMIPDVRTLPFGHMGDGNIHFNFTQPKGMDREKYMAYRLRVNEIIFELVLELGGSISAEHGIGLFKRDWMKRIKSPIELSMMASIKKNLDPDNIMNPGKVLPMDDYS